MTTPLPRPDKAKAPLHVAIFCRPALPGTCKTRLIPAYGAQGAAAIYGQLVGRTLRTVQATCAVTGASASIWVAGDLSHPSVVQWSTVHSMPRFAQCEGDLGQRMFDCLDTLARTHERVLLMGTDCPALDVAHVRAAADALAPDCPWVFTPAEDGGYVLVGSNRPAMAPFTDIAWSTHRVMAQTRRALSRHALAWAEMATLWDVDEPADVERARTAGFINTP